MWSSADELRRIRWCGDRRIEAGGVERWNEAVEADQWRDEPPSNPWFK